MNRVVRHTQDLQQLFPYGSHFPLSQNSSSTLFSNSTRSTMFSHETYLLEEETCFIRGFSELVRF
ncbi:hypothetical protein ES332_A07G224200v1 [Gossypium tomentosum]|uniref:Uncharacterized protein n=1 Tax=Gossypium tomentosum TaxID=34277 RepID=A0A5D2PW62_GOSTO|nr:hypothetical protein ES332_A07G224200v1 [Gossypium tomentosum]